MNTKASQGRDKSILSSRSPVFVGIWLFLFFFTSSWVRAQVLVEPPASPPDSLKNHNIAPTPGISQFVRSDKWLLVLGKALFWDQQVGSDGQACASCHFTAGADTRSKNQLSPGLLAMPKDETFQLGGPNYQLVAGDFPIGKAINDVVSSQGVFFTLFDALNPPSRSQIEDNCTDDTDLTFHVDGTNVRRVEPRHTPTTINAAFNFANFWDGRANNILNFTDPFGKRNPDAFVYKRNPNGTVVKVAALAENSSLGSQALGPPLSIFEMSCQNRTFNNIGRKMMRRKLLRFQEVHPDDSVLGPWRHTSGQGLRYVTQQLIQRAFKPEWWRAGIVEDDFKQIEANFRLFWSIAIQRYEQSLISDDSPYDKAMDSPSTYTLTSEEQNGLDVFLDKGKCINCHKTSMFTGASTLHLLGENEEEGLVERMNMGDHGTVNDRGPALYDNGFYNIGVRQTDEDISRGADGPFGNPLSFTKQYVEMLLGNNAPDPFEIDPCKFEIRWTEDDFPVAKAADNLRELDCDGDNVADTVEPKPPFNAALEAEIRAIRTAVNGAFKVPTIRNVELTGPYFHNGGQSTLRQVVEFYNRGGDFRQENQADLDPDIQPLDLTEEEKTDLVAFMLTLTDERVRFDKAPFDHPELIVPNGGLLGEQGVLSCLYSNLCDNTISIEAVGENGRITSNATFLDLDPQDP